MTPPDWLTLAEAAEIAGKCSVDTLRRAIAAGELIGYKLGVMKVKTDDLQDWIESRKTKAKRRRGVVVHRREPRLTEF